ncbi:uncharacterized protein [Pyxicephalus adspersus]|uniref:uncharacterized protein isoform X2 n=1 Tax=Pyxicephalus adspersus TaxID=30357 RepID=UPI003B5B905B
MIRHRYDQQRSIFVKRQIAERLPDRLWTPEGRPPTVARIQHVWSDLKRRRPDLVREVGDRILSANSPSRRLRIIQWPHRRLAIPQDLKEEETTSPGEGEEVPVPSPKEKPVVEEVPSLVEEEPSPEEEPAAPHPQPESSDEGEEAAEAKDIASAAAPLPPPSPPHDCDRAEFPQAVPHFHLPPPLYPKHTLRPQLG